MDYWRNTRPCFTDASFTGLGWATMLDIYDLYSEIVTENLTADTIIGTMDDGRTYEE